MSVGMFVRHWNVSVGNCALKACLMAAFTATFSLFPSDFRAEDAAQFGGFLLCHLRNTIFFYQNIARGKANVRILEKKCISLCRKWINCYLQVNYSNMI